MLPGKTKVSPHRHISGMTLVELLIVFSIVGLLVALVSPLTARQMDRARGQEELLVLSRTIDTLSFRAFADGRTVSLTGRGRELIWQFAGEPTRSLQLEQVSFNPEQKVRININGFADREGLTVMFAGRERTIELNRWLQDKKQ